MPTPITPVTISHQKIDIEADYKALISGINTELAQIDPLLVAGATLPRASLVARFQARIDAAESVKAARSALQTAVAQERDVDAETRPLRAALKVFLQGRYGKNSPELQKFGFAQGRKAKPTAQTKAAGQAKAKATRAALGTKGTQQKKAIMKAATAAPVDSPAPAHAPATPAGAAPATTK
jgi:hypothetical protein